MFQIEKGVELTPPKGTPKYPWRDMEVGDSFFVPGVTTDLMSVNAFKAGKTLGRKFATRTVDGGVRVWRTA